jgi:hypothetical protein
LLGGVAAAFLVLFLGPGYVLAERVVNSGEPIVVSDDITDRTVAVQSLDGNGNQGHGNNEDGVDSSNPGQGGGGPNGSVDESCSGDGSCVDDEGSGGGSSVSLSKEK